MTNIFSKYRFNAGASFPYLTPNQLLSLDSDGNVISSPPPSTQYQEYLYPTFVSSITINHNWGIKPFVVILSLDGLQDLEGIVSFPDDNTVTVSFNPPSSCRIILYGRISLGSAPSTPDAIQSIFGRVGVITAQPGDYTAAQVGADPVGTALSLVNTHANTVGLHLSTGVITDPHISSSAGINWSKVSKTGAKASDIGALSASNNLSDLSNPSTARTNLGLGTSSTQSSATFAQVVNNLSDLVSISTARTNLGLGSAATQASSSFLQVANNLSDLSNAPTARANIGASTPSWNANQLQGRPISSTAPSNDQALVWNTTTSAWEPATVVTNVLGTTLIGFSPSAQTVTSSHTVLQGLSYLQGQLNNITFTAGYFNGGNSTGADASLGLLSNYQFSLLTNNARRFSISANGAVNIWDGSNRQAVPSGWMGPASLTVGSSTLAMGQSGGSASNNTAGFLFECANDFYFKGNDAGTVFEFISYRRNSGNRRITIGDQTNNQISQLLFKSAKYFEFSNGYYYSTDTMNAGGNLPPIYTGDDSRTALYVRGRHPFICLQGDNHNNIHHGPVIHFTALDSDNSTQQNWKFGIPSLNARFFQLAWASGSGTSVDPHWGLRGSNGFPPGLTVVAPGKSQNNTLGNNYGFGFNNVEEPQYTVQVNGSIGVGTSNSYFVTLSVDSNYRPTINTPGNWDLSIKRNSVEYLRLDSTVQALQGLAVTGTLSTTTGLSVNGTQIIGTTRPSIPTLSLSATLTDVINKVNAIINALNGSSSAHRLFS